MEVTYLGHAAILVRSGGTSLLMDPWLVDPAYCDTWFHDPPLALTVEDLGPVDYVWCSHDHPDHCDPKTLRKLPREQKFLVPQFASGRLERDLRGLGFTELIPLPFDRELELAADFTVTGIRTDLVWEDSALVVRAGGSTLFNMNDCKLGDELLAALGERYAPDIAFVPFSGAIQYPTCYGYDEARLAELCRARRRQHLQWFVHRIELLRAARGVPFAGNFALLAPDMLWMNEPDKNNFNTPDQAIAALAAAAPAVEGLQMNPGDRWTRAAGLVRHAPPPDFGTRMQRLRQRSAELAPQIAELRAAEPPARPSLRADVEAWFRRAVDQNDGLAARIDARVVIDTDGPHGGRWCLQFDAAGLTMRDFRDGDDWNLRMTIPSALLQQAADGAITWDELALSFRVQFAENPEFFNRDFWVMLYNPDPVFLGPYLADPAPKF